MFDKLYKEIKPHVFSFFNFADLKQTSGVSKEWNELSHKCLIPYLTSQLNLAVSCKQESVFFEQILQSNKKIAEAILSTFSILDDFINLAPGDRKFLVDTRGINCLIKLIEKYPDTAAENLDLLFYKLDSPFKSGKPALKFWSGELFSQSCRLALNLLDKHEIIDYFKKNKYLLANRFRESLEIAPEVAEKFASHDELLDLLKDMGFEINLAIKTGSEMAK